MKTLVIVSGGADSTTLLYDVIAQGDEVTAISFNYGQKHKKELNCAAKICHKLNIEHKILDISGVFNAVMSSNSLTGDKEVPEGHYAEDTMKSTVVPFRNAIFMINAAAVASTIKYDRVAYGAHGGDHAIYPDCRPEFVDSMRSMMQVADYAKIGVYAPFLDIDKGEVIKKGIALGVPYEDTWSCYKGLEKSCGKCGTCVERLEAFNDVGVADPIEYN